MGRQSHRNNVPADTPQDYFRRGIWYPYLDAVTQSISQRFTAHSTLVNKIASLIPSQIGSFNWDDVKESILFYRDIVEATDDEQIRFQFLE